MNPKDKLASKKVDLSLVPPASIIYEAQAMEFGGLSGMTTRGVQGHGYGPFNWRENKVNARVYIAAAMRHLLSYLDGEDVADDSKVHHLGHAKACCGIVLDAMETGNLIDDRPSTGPASRLLKPYSPDDAPQGGICQCAAFCHDHKYGIGCIKDGKIVGRSEPKRQGDLY